jgi:hypothetical protein
MDLTTAKGASSVEEALHRRAAQAAIIPFTVSSYNAPSVTVPGVGVPRTMGGHLDGRACSRLRHTAVAGGRPGAFTFLPHKVVDANVPGHNQVNDVFQDEEGLLWLATAAASIPLTCRPATWAWAFSLRTRVLFLPAAGADHLP